VTADACVETIGLEMDQCGFEQAVLVGHSMAGVTLLKAMALMSHRIRHAVFLAADVPLPGESLVDMVRRANAGPDGAPDDEQLGAMIAGSLRQRFGNDLDDEQYAWCMELRVPESARLAREPADHSGLSNAIARTWIRTTLDATNLPSEQEVYATRIQAPNMVDLAAGHMCMISQPEKLAALLDTIAASD
jgi:pimeloyl-ACP methyl ester carboxylesterase